MTTLHAGLHLHSNMDFINVFEPSLDYLASRRLAGGLVVWVDTIAQSHHAHPDDSEAVEGGIYGPFEGSG